MASHRISTEASSTDTSSQVSTDRSTSPSIDAPLLQPEYKYYVAYDEAKADGVNYAQLCQQPDGFTLYRALARQLIGAPTEHGAIAQAVLNFAIRVRSHQSHPLHEQYLGHESSFRSATGHELFSLLECPDLLPRDEIYWVIAHALDCRLKVYSTLTAEAESRGLSASVGVSTSPLCAVLQSPCHGPITTRFSALMPDESGKALLEYLLETKAGLESQPSCNDKTQPEIKKMVWAWKKPTRGNLNVTCFNEHRSNSQMNDLNLDDLPNKRMDVLATVVSESRQVPKALAIFRRALELAPAQERSVRVSKTYEKGFMKPHFSADVEFVKLPKHKLAWKGRQEQNALVDCGEVEELCSVLTVANSRHYCISFNILHMMEHPDAQTVSAISQIFREIIFNPATCKLWWNLQSDFTVMDSTIAHLFQGTPRHKFKRRSYRGIEHNITPTWKLHSTFFDGTRPAPT